MSAYYNEIDPLKAEVLREAIKAGAIAPGDVDERSIVDVLPHDLAGYTQCHFFAGGGFWSLAFRYAGWPDDRPAWSGSCPCPSFSAAGKGQGFSDPRHLWPHWVRLISVCRPAVVFGEQVAAAIGHGWLDLVQADMERDDYAFGSAVLGACSVGAPHIRQRLFFVAESSSKRYDGRRSGEESLGTKAPEQSIAVFESERSRDALRMGESEDAGLQERELHSRSIREADGTSEGQGFECGGDPGRMAEPMHSERRPLDVDGSDGCDGQDVGRPKAHSEFGTCSEVRGVADADSSTSEWGTGSIFGEEAPRDAQRLSVDGSVHQRLEHDGEDVRPGPVNGFWSDADWIGCRDGKFRPVRPGSFPLAYGSTARVGRLRMYGDGIVVQAATEFIKAYLESRS